MVAVARKYATNARRRLARKDEERGDIYIDL